MRFIHTPLQSGFFTSYQFLVFGFLLLGLFLDEGKNQLNQALNHKNATQNRPIEPTKNTIGQNHQNPHKKDVNIPATEDKFSKKLKPKIKLFYRYLEKVFSDR